MSARVNPYARLKTVALALRRAVKWPERRTMFTLTGAKLGNKSWDFSEVYQRTVAADALGWDVVLRPSGEDLLIEYRKRPAFDVVDASELMP